MPEQTTIGSDSLKRAKQLVKDAEADRQRHETWINALYRHTMPWRTRIGDTEQKHDQDDLFDDEAIQSTSDFANDMNLLFTPEFMDWMLVEPVNRFDGVSQADLRGVNEAIKEYRQVVFEAIRQSNFHEKALESYSDLAIGTMAMQIQDQAPSRPFFCQGIPATNLLLGRGAFGGTDIRAREFKPKYRELPVYYPGATFPESVAGNINSTPDKEIEVTEVTWRDWAPAYTEAWNYVVYCDQGLMLEDTFKGVGSNPISAARWRTDMTTAWGIGPLYTILPTIRIADELGYLVLKQANRTVDPPFLYDDDGVLAFDQGITPGFGYARQPGSRFDIIEGRSKFDISYFTQDDLQHRIKRALFQDKPQQIGKTPPSATQFFEERAETARRIPVAGIAREWQVQVFTRFAWLLSERGDLPKVEFDGKDVALRPVSPLVRDQKQDQVLVFSRFMEIGTSFFGQEVMQVLVDPMKSLNALKDMLNAEGVHLRNDAEAEQLLSKIIEGARAVGALPPQEGTTQ